MRLESGFLRCTRKDRVRAAGTLRSSVHTMATTTLGLREGCSQRQYPVEVPDSLKLVFPAEYKFHTLSMHCCKANGLYIRDDFARTCLAK